MYACQDMTYIDVVSAKDKNILRHVVNRMAKFDNKFIGKYLKFLFKDNTIFCETLNTVKGPLSVTGRNKLVSLLKINV